MEVSKQILNLFLFPFLILFIFVSINLIGSNVPTNSVFIDAYFGRDFIDVNETWIIPVLENEYVFRKLPFEDVEITSVNCDGDAFISYDGKYEIICEGDFVGEATLSLSYTIKDPYICYEDVCVFRSSFFENTKVDTIEFTSVNANTFTFPNLIDGISSSVSAFNLIALLPIYFKGNSVEIMFEEELLQIGTQLSLFTKFENNYFINFIRIVSLEMFILFILVLVSKKYKIKKAPFEALSVKRSPFEVFKLFFKSLDENSVISASILNLARNNLIKITSRHIKVLDKKPKNKFDKNLLNLLNLISENKSIFLDDDWLNERKNKIGKEKIKEVITILKQTKVSYEVQKEMYKSSFKGVVMCIEFCLFVLSSLMFLIVPTYLVKFRISLILFGILNFIWLLLTRKSKVFFSYSDEWIKEKTEMDSLLNLIKSKVQMKTAKKLDWDYLIVFSAMHDLEMDVIKIAEKNNKKQSKIKSPHLVLEMMHSFISDV